MKKNEKSTHHYFAGYCNYFLSLFKTSRSQTNINSLFFSWLIQKFKQITHKFTEFEYLMNKSKYQGLNSENIQWRNILWRNIQYTLKKTTQHYKTWLEQKNPHNFHTLCNWILLKKRCYEKPLNFSSPWQFYSCILHHQKAPSFVSESIPNFCVYRKTPQKLSPPHLEEQKSEISENFSHHKFCELGTVLEHVRLRVRFLSDWTSLSLPVQLEPRTISIRWHLCVVDWPAQSDGVENVDFSFCTHTLPNIHSLRLYMPSRVIDQCSYWGESHHLI